MKTLQKKYKHNFFPYLILLLHIFTFHIHPHTDFVHLDCLSLDDGLSHNLVYSISQDKYGFMWFGTPYGLNKYDGYKFITFNNKQSDNTSISSNLILCSHLDQNQNLWFGTASGLNLYNYQLENFQSFNIPNQSKSNSSKNEITAIAQSQSNELIIGTKSEGLYKFDIKDKSFQKINIDSNNIKNISVLCTDKNESIWIGTSHGLVCYNTSAGKFNIYKHNINSESTIGGSNIYSLFFDKNILWIGHENGIDCLDLNPEFSGLDPNKSVVFKHFKLPPGEFAHSPKIVSTIFRDAAGTLWIGTHGSGLYFFNKITNKFHFYRPCKCLKDTGGLSSTWINKIYQNKNGTIWVGTNEGLGKFTFNKQFFNKYEYEKNSNNSLCQGEVKALHQDRDGNIWIGTWGNGICKLEPESGIFSHIKKKKSNLDGLSSNFVSEIYEDSEGTIWIGLDKPIGLYKYDPNSKKLTQQAWNFQDSDDFIPHPISSIIETNNNILWIGTAGGGLIRFDTNLNKFSIYKNDIHNPSSLCSNHIYTINHESPNFLLIGTTKGMCRLEIDTEIFQRIKNYQQGNAVYSILKSKNNYCWLGTNNGLYKSKFEQQILKIQQIITEKDGLGGNQIYGILSDSADHIWLLTNKGLSVYYPNTNQIRNFTTEDGCVKFTKKLSHGSNAQLLTDNGYMFFGGVNGLTYFRLDELMGESGFNPPILITDIQLNNKSITPVNSSILDSSIANTNNILIPSDFGNLSINFSILDYTAPSENQYAYILKGWDQEWIYSGTQHTAHYAAIPPGDYTFVVKGANHEGLWNNEGKKLNINIYPLFWETWWFRTFGGLFFILIVIGGHYYQIQKVKKEKILQEEISRKVIDSQESERKRIASELHDSLGQNLQVINSGLTQLNNQSKKNNEKHLNELSFLIKDSIKEVREIAYDLHPHQLEQLGLQKAIESAIKKIAYISTINFNVSIGKIDKYFNEQDSIHLFRIIQEAVNNIYKHSHAKNAIIDIHKKNNEINIYISDDGKGFILESLFSDDKPVKESLGLSNMYERVKLINGNLSIESGIDNGTAVKISIPAR